MYPGDSGGPLLNDAGSVIGVVSGTIGPENSETSQLGLAIPSNITKFAVMQWIERGFLYKNELGVNVISLQGAENLQKNLPTELISTSKSFFNTLGVKQGVIILAIAEGSPAAEANLRKGDLITNVNGNPISSEIDLYQAIFTAENGSTASIVYYRAGVELVAQVSVKEFQVKGKESIPTKKNDHTYSQIFLMANLMGVAGTMIIALVSAACGNTVLAQNLAASRLLMNL